jgi:hypothetical protein
VKLSGRAQGPDQSRGHTISSSAHGDTTELHGPLERLLGDRAAAATAMLMPFGVVSCVVVVSYVVAVSSMVIMVTTCASI